MLDFEKYRSRFEKLWPTYSEQELLELFNAKIDYWQMMIDNADQFILSDEERTRLYNDFGLSSNEAFTGGTCYGMAASSLMYKRYPEKIQDFVPDFYYKVMSGSIWNNLDIETNSSGSWNENNDELTTIIKYQLMQYYNTSIAQSLYSYSTGALNVLNELKNYPDEPYIIRFSMSPTSTGSFTGHAVVPYKVEGNRIYIYDNNAPYTEDNDISHNLYLEVTSTGGLLYPYYKTHTQQNFFKKLAIHSIDGFELADSIVGYGDNYTLLTLDGKSDLQIIDSEGRITGFSGGTIIEEIPGAYVFTQDNLGLNGIVHENRWKQIYLPQKQDIKIKIVAKGQEKYNLRIAGGDYHTNFNSVKTSTGEVDIFNSSINKIKVNFDDNKAGDYNIVLDNFQTPNTKSVKIIGSMLKENQVFDIDWEKVKEHSKNAIIHRVDTNNNGKFNESIELSSVLHNKQSSTKSNNIISRDMITGQTKGLKTDSNEENKEVSNSDGFVLLDATYYITGKTK